jgi:thiosulfate/3-mercaptopyruvate sulfurtransferase
MQALVTTDWLAEHLENTNIVLADVRWEHNSSQGARELFERGHIPGATYISLDDDLSDRRDPRKGRHPLPEATWFVKRLAEKGIGQDSQIIAYDDKAGSLAARLWWMLRWIGGPEVKILDGGLGKWMAEGRAMETGAGRIPTHALQAIHARPHDEMIISAKEIEATTPSKFLLLDARAPERYRGELEPIDARAGHIPGAVNVPWAENLRPDQTLKAADELKARFSQVGVGSGQPTVCYCGSGVTTCHNLLALELAGFSGARLYVGSWSEWAQTHE